MVVETAKCNHISVSDITIILPLLNPISLDLLQSESFTECQFPFHQVSSNQHKFLQESQKQCLSLSSFLPSVFSSDSDIFFNLTILIV